MKHRKEIQRRFFSEILLKMSTPKMSNFKVKASLLTLFPAFKVSCGHVEFHVDSNDCIKVA
jgi:type III secretory pathway component EscR